MSVLQKKIPWLIGTSILLFVAAFVVYLFDTFSPKYETPPSTVITEEPTDTPGGNLETVIVITPQANSLANSPLNVQGQATGTWFFEAALPLQIRDANDAVIGRGVASAQTDWMTDQLVPFAGTIEFTTPTTPSGWLVIKANNPSGLPEHDDEFRLPVRFE